MQMEDGILERSRTTPSKLSLENGLRRRVFLCDENVLVREELAELIEAQHDMCCCGVADSVDAARELLRDSNPDIILSELKFEDTESVASISDLALETGKSPILVWTSCDEVVFAEGALRAGARGYVMKGVPTEELLGAIRTVLAGNVYLSQPMTIRVIRRMLKPRKAHEREYQL